MIWNHTSVKASLIIHERIKISCLFLKLINEEKNMLISSGTLQPKNRKAAIAKSLTVCVICLSTIQALCPIPKRKKNVLDITYRYFKTGANVLERIINYCCLQLGFSPSHMGKLFSCLK